MVAQSPVPSSLKKPIAHCLVAVVYHSIDGREIDPSVALLLKALQASAAQAGQGQAITGDRFLPHLPPLFVQLVHVAFAHWPELSLHRLEGGEEKRRREGVISHSLTHSEDYSRTHCSRLLHTSSEARPPFVRTLDDVPALPPHFTAHHSSAALFSLLSRLPAVSSHCSSSTSTATTLQKSS